MVKKTNHRIVILLWVFSHMFLVASQARSTNVATSDQDIATITSITLPNPKCFASNVVDAQADQCVLLPASYVPSGNITIVTSPTCGLSTVIPAEKLGSCSDAQATLDAHNAARVRYGAAPLLWSRTLSNYAQSVSNTCIFQHSNGPYGENLAIGTSMTCKQALNLWVAEEKQYPPNRTPGFSESTGHFTQVVWKLTTQVGCAIKTCNGQNFVTCSYNPPGNVIGQFASQVGRPGDVPECVSPPPGSTPPPTPCIAPRPPPPAAPTSPSPPGSKQCCFLGYFCFPC